MRIFIAKEQEGKREVTVVPGRLTHIPLVVVRGTSRTEIMEAVAGVILEVDAEERAHRGKLSPRVD